MHHHFYWRHSHSTEKTAQSLVTIYIVFGMLKLRFQTSQIKDWIRKLESIVKRKKTGTVSPVLFLTWGVDDWWIYSSIAPKGANQTHLTPLDSNFHLALLVWDCPPPERNTSTFSYLEVIFTKYIKKNIGLLALAYSTVQQLSVNISPMIILSKSKSQGKDSRNVTRRN